MQTSNPKQEKSQGKRQGNGETEMSPAQGACGTAADEMQNRPSIQGREVKDVKELKKG